MSKNKQDSGADAPESSIAISVEDMKFIDQNRYKLSKKAYLHEMIKAYRVSIGL
jgi:hypothetical protein